MGARIMARPRVYVNQHSRPMRTNTGVLFNRPTVDSTLSRRMENGKSSRVGRTHARRSPHRRQSRFRGKNLLGGRPTPDSEET